MKYKLVTKRDMKKGRKSRVQQNLKKDMKESKILHNKIKKNIDVKLTRRTGVSAGNRGARRSGIAEHSGEEIGDPRWLPARTSLLSPSFPPCCGGGLHTDGRRAGRPPDTANHSQPKPMVK